MDYAAMARTAQALIHKNGGPITLVSTPRGAYNPLAGPGDPLPNLITPLIAVVVPAKMRRLQYFETSVQKGSYTLSRLRSVLIAGLDLPNGLDETTDQLQFEGATWGILGFDTTSPDGGATNILFDVMVQR